MELKIRPATFGDIKAIFTIEQLCFDPEEAFNKQIFSFFLLRRRREIFLVATIPRDGEKEKRQREKANDFVVGFIIAQAHSVNRFEIITLDVHPDFRRRGIGKSLMLELEEVILEGFRRVEDEKNNRILPSEIIIELTVYEKNEAAKRLYWKLGYKNTRLVLNYYRKGRHGIQMVKTITKKD